MTRSDLSAPDVVADLVACAATARTVASRLIGAAGGSAWRFAVDDLDAAIERARRWQRGKPLVLRLPDASIDSNDRDEPDEPDEEGEYRCA